MKSRFRLFATTILAAALPVQLLAAESANEWTAEQRRAVLDSTVTIRLAPDLARLTPAEKTAVAELLATGRLLQSIYEDERHPQAAAIRTRLAQEPDSDFSTLYRLFQGPIATTLDNRREPFVAVAAETPGKNVYPWGIEAAEIDRYLAAHPGARSELLDDRTVVRRATPEALAADLATLDRYPLIAGLHPFLAARLRALAAAPDPAALYAVPYPVAHAEALFAAYLHLMRAGDALAGEDVEFAGYLRNRARDLLSNDYESGDASWTSGRFGRLNAQIGSYETYDDALFGVKAFHSLSLLLRDEEATAKLGRSLGSLQEIEDALPYPAPKKKVRSDIPVAVYEVIADFGQARGTNTATNLPNDPMHSRKYGRTILMRANILRNATLSELSLRRWRAAVNPRFGSDYSGEGGFQRTLWHEIGHYLGPDTTRDGRTLDEALGTWADACEEMKSDLVSLFAYHELARRGLVTPEALRGVQASGVLRALNSHRPRRDQPYQTMQLAQFNYFVDRGLLAFDADGRLDIRHERYAATVEGLLREVLLVQSSGDPAVAESFFARWTAWGEPHEGLAAKLREAEGPRYRLVRYGALGE
ncbi:MAG: NUDIX hydrolase [Thermoanaerobaculia bacterium]